jgi:hypothetical protein
MHVDHRLLVLERHVGELCSARRPGRRDDRLLRDQCRLRILTIGIGNLQLEAVDACLDDIGDARREDAGLPDQLFVDDVGDAVAGGAQLRRTGDEGGACSRCPAKIS